LKSTKCQGGGKISSGDWGHWSQEPCKTTTTPAPAERYDCDGGYSNWKAGWASEKKEWCCHHHHKGCEKAPADAPGVAHHTQGKLPVPKPEHVERSESFDCDHEFSHWRAAWTDRKMDWCCDHYDKGCKHSTEKEKYDCNTTNVVPDLEWSDSKKDWCCEHHDKGCKHKNVFEAFDCDAAFSNWKFAWSDDKKEYCCEHKKKGCTTTTTTMPPKPEPFNCDNDYGNWSKAWDEDKKKYCCDHHDKGCKEIKCHDYMANIGCGWTAEYSCPKQPHGLRYKWDAHNDGDKGYDASSGWICCCEKEGWKQAFPPDLYQGL
jgi:hypothetical protein